MATCKQCNIDEAHSDGFCSDSCEKTYDMTISSTMPSKEQMRKVIVLTMGGTLIMRAFGSWRDVRVLAGPLLASFAGPKADVNAVIDLLMNKGHFVCHVPSGARGTIVEAHVLNIEEG